MIKASHAPEKVCKAHVHVGTVVVEHLAQLEPHRELV